MPDAAGPFSFWRVYPRCCGECGTVALLHGDGLALLSRDGLEGDLDHVVVRESM